MFTDVGPQLVPARVSVVLVEETGVRCAGRLASVLVDLDEQMLAEVACPADVAECVDDFILPMLAGTVLIRPWRNTVFGRSCWDAVPSRPCWDIVPV